MISFQNNRLIPAVTVCSRDQFACGFLNAQTADGLGSGGCQRNGNGNVVCLLKYLLNDMMLYGSKGSKRIDIYVGFFEKFFGFQNIVKSCQIIGRVTVIFSH